MGGSSNSRELSSGSGSGEKSEFCARRFVRLIQHMVDGPYS